jgi:hypothetical protein
MTKIKNWRELNDLLCTFSENELQRMIEEERKGARRQSILRRLHQRYCMVRAIRERAAILADAE